MKDFILKMLSSSEDISHKRSISLCSFICIIIVLLFDLVGVKASQYLVYIFAGLILGSSGLSVIDKNFQNVK